MEKGDVIDIFMTDLQYDKKLKIQTIGRNDEYEDDYHYPYEPSPYTVLERLAGSGFISRNSHVIDYGCGMGRVGFFLNYKLGCRVTGIEFNEKIYRQAINNLEKFMHGDGVRFLYIDAVDYEIESADCFYFFNPFSVEILQTVLGRILESYYEAPRVMKLFFYYPSDEYISLLMTMSEVTFLDEIDCRDLFEGNNKREKILIFEIGIF